ncbi:protein kinase [Streptomyces sp. NPDC006923]|uniref:protein kinase domain-containing protein n=1 Tax=Streptomyces sp. NPDC006923 TaxID=3155355 RepID=UPI0033E48D68
MEKLAAGDPQRIGDYRLLARLGAGGMGQVYLARSDRGRTVAVKLVRQELAEEKRFRDRFRQEVAAARRVGGAWTAPVLDADTEAATPWLATGYMAGPALQSVVSGPHGPLPERSVRILASGLAHALQDIHAAGVIHRDLKPSNVLVTIGGPRVIDFGIARALETAGDSDPTRPGAPLGSPGFMAPEQVRGERVTAACDVFCLGSVLAYAATGRSPFGAADPRQDTSPALMFRIAQEEPNLSGLPRWLAELVDACLQKDPAERPTTKDILARVGEFSDSGVGPGGEPWLPVGLLAQLGQHAVQLLEHENPAEQTPSSSGVVARVEPPPWVAPGVSGMPTMIVAAASPAAAPAVSPPPAGGPVQAPAEGLSPAPNAARPPGRPAQALPPAARTPALPPGGQAPPLTPVPPQGQRPYGHPHPGPGGPAPTPYAPPPQYGGAPGPAAPHGPAPVPEPEPRKRGAFTLIAVAVIVALGAAGSVYAFLGGDSAKDDRATRASDSQDPKPPAGDGPGSSSPSSPASASPSPSAEKGEVPAEYLGTWTGGVGTGSGFSPRRLVIRQGDVGETVLSLTADGPAANGGTSYHCVFEAPLASAPASGAPLSIGPSKVTTGEPMTACTPGTPTELTILSDGSLRRVTTTGDALTYKKAG